MLIMSIITDVNHINNLWDVHLLLIYLDVLIISSSQVISRVAADFMLIILTIFEMPICDSAA